MNDNLINLKEMTRNDLIVLIGRVEKEIEKRDKEKNLKLINNFKNAYYAMREAGINIHYECDDVIPIDNWDSFYFS